MSLVSEAYFANKDKIEEILIGKLEYKRLGNRSVVEEYEPLDENCDFRLRVSTGTDDVDITLNSVKHHIFDCLALESKNISLAEVVEFLRFYGYAPAVRLSRILFIDDILKEL